MFAAGRAFEQVRNSVGYPKLNVKIACSHGGVTPANDGASHQCIEDMGVLRTLPNMTIIMPADYWSARRLVEAAAEFDGPVYLRFTRDAIPVIYDENATFEIGKANKLKEGKDKVIGFLMGQVMKEMKGKANPSQVSGMIHKLVQE